MLPSYFDYIFVHIRQKVCLRLEQTKPEIFVNFRPEPNPKSPARLTTLFLNVKDLVLSSYFKNARYVIQWHQNIYFFKKLLEVVQRLVTCLSYIRLLTTFPNLDILTFQHLLQTLPLQ